MARRSCILPMSARKRLTGKAIPDAGPWSIGRRAGSALQWRCARMASCSVCSWPTGKKYDRSPRSRSHYCKTSRRRRSSRWRTRGCSTNCATAPRPAEALEYQTAISDVLKVISRSTVDLQPVLDTWWSPPLRLCVADQAVVFRRDAEMLTRSRRISAFRRAYEEHHRARGPIPAALHAEVSPRSFSCGVRAAGDPYRRCRRHPGYREASVDAGEAAHDARRAIVARRRTLLGVLALARQQVEPFTERQIELVRKFAAQAVIAMENARLLSELRAHARPQELLEYQTATSEVLKVISRSTFDLAAGVETVRRNGRCGCAAPITATFDIATGEGDHCCGRGVQRDARYMSGSQRNVRSRRYPATASLGRTARRQRSSSRGRADRPGVPAMQDVVEPGRSTDARRAAAAQGDADRRHRYLPDEVEPFTDEQIALLQHLRRPGGHRDGERAADRRIARAHRDLQERSNTRPRPAEVLRVISRSTGRSAAGLG